MTGTEKAVGDASLRIAVLGAGKRANEYLDTIVRLGAFFRLVGICDADIDRARRIAAERSTDAFERIEDMLVRARPDLLFVCIPPDGHRPAVELSAAHGIHVLCETPIAPTLALADAMIAACRQHNVLLEVAENVWRWPGERLKQQIIRAGLLGEVTQVHLRYSSGSYHGIGAVRQLIPSDPVLARGYVHEASVPVHVDRLGRTVRAGWYELGLVEFASDTLLVYQNSLLPHEGNRWDVIGTAGAIFGDEVNVFTGDERCAFRIQRRIDTSTDPPRLDRVEVEMDPPVVWENPWRHLPIGAGEDDVARADVLMGLHEAITHGGQLVYGATNARADQEVLFAIRESALRDGVRLTLPLSAPTEAERRVHDQYRRRYGHDPLAPAEVALDTLYPNPPPATVALEPLFAGVTGGGADARAEQSPMSLNREAT